MYMGFHEDGDRCPTVGCSGRITYGEVEGCSCHISPPCAACVSNPLQCRKCGWTDESEPEFNDAQVALGLSQREYKPRKLDKTKIDFRSKMHSDSSMIKEGVYPEGTSAAEVREKVDGTFGGRFEQFGSGRFRFVAYTD